MVSKILGRFPFNPKFREISGGTSNGTNHFGLVRPGYSGPALKVVNFDRSGRLDRNVPSGKTNQKHYPDKGSDMSSVWNFWARSSEVMFTPKKSVVASRNVDCFPRLACEDYTLNLYLLFCRF